MPSKKVSYTGISFTDSQPKYAPGTIYGADFKFSNQTINANLGDNTYGWIELKVSWNRLPSQPSLDISKGDRVVMHVRHPQGASWAIAEKDANGNHLFQRGDSTINGYIEMDLTPSTDSGASEKTFIFIANSNPDEPTEASYTINFAVGLRKDRAVHAGEFDLEYTCVKPIYKYEMGVHPYSAYDAAYSPEHTMDLYSFTPIDNWGVNTRAYWDSWMSYPAPSYYFTQKPANGVWPSSPGSTAPTIYKFGDDVDRGFGIARYYQVVKKWLFGKTRVYKKIEGPKSYHTYQAGDDRPNKIKTCCIPQMTDVGKIKSIILSENIVKPSNYKYYLAFDSSNAITASEKAFGYYHWSKKRYYRISGIRHILEKWMQGYQKGYVTNWNMDLWALSSIGLGGAFFLSGLLTSGFSGGSSWLAKELSKIWFSPGNWGLKAGEAIWKFFGGRVASGAFAATMNIIGSILSGIGVLFSLITLFKTRRRLVKEPCLELEAAYHENPYIKTTAKIWNDSAETSFSTGVFTDGIQDYLQNSSGVGLISYQQIQSLVSPDPIEFDFHHAPKVRTGTKLVTNEEIMALLYVAGIPVSPCSPSTTYYSVAKTTNILTNAGALENCPAAITVNLPAGHSWSCTSQTHADTMATAYFDKLITQALENINERDCGFITGHDTMGVEFTHELKVETNQNYTDVFWGDSAGNSYNWDTSLSDMIGANFYLDEQGHYPAFDGYYCNSQPFNGPNNTSLYKVFYQVQNGVVQDVWTLQTSSSNSATSANGNSPQSLSTFKLDYRSDWVILRPTMLEIHSTYDEWTSDPNNLETPTSVMSYGLKARTQDTSLSTFEMEVYDAVNSQWIEADEGWYGNLVGWPLIDGQYEEGDIYRYNRAKTIKVSVESQCPTSSLGLPYGSKIVFKDSNGDYVEPGVETTLSLEVKESGSTLETRTVRVDGFESTIYSPHQGISIHSNVDAYAFTDLPKTVGKRTFSFDSNSNVYCNPVDYDLIVTHQAGANNTTIVSVDSALGLGVGTFYYTDLNNSFAGTNLAYSTNSNTGQLQFTYNDLDYQSYNIEIITPNGKNTRYIFTPTASNSFTGEVQHSASDSSSTNAVSNWTINDVPVTFNMRVFSGVHYAGQSTSVRFRVYNNVGGILLNDQTITAGPPGYGTEQSTYTISQAGSYQWIVEVTGTTGPSLAGYGIVQEAATVTPNNWSPSGTAAWIDASDTSSYTKSGLTSLASVTDKASTYTLNINGNPTTDVSTQNGLNVFDFDGSGDYIQSTTYENVVGAGNHWAIGVFRWETVNSNKDTIWSFETNQSPKRDYALSSGNSGNTWPGELDLDGLSGNNKISSQIGNAESWTLKSLTQNQYHVVACWFNKAGNQIGVRVDGSNAFTPVNDYDKSLSTNQQLRLMRNRSSQALAGKLAEFFAVADIPGTSGTDISELEKAEGYLAHKWGLTGSLPSNHPYKTTHPTS